MSSYLRYEPTRRQLSVQQADTVGRLVQSALEILSEHGGAGLSVRAVAARAGVAPATAYTYFSSKEHLVAEVFWRRLRDHGANMPVVGDRIERTVAVLRGVALLVADEPALATAVTAALLADDQEVEQLRVRIGLDIRRRLHSALIEPESPPGLQPVSGDVDPTVLDALEMVYAGALLRAGMGYSSYSDVADAIGTAARHILENRP